MNKKGTTPSPVAAHVSHARLKTVVQSNRSAARSWPNTILRECAVRRKTKAIKLRSDEGVSEDVSKKSRNAYARVRFRPEVDESIVDRCFSFITLMLDSTKLFRTPIQRLPIWRSGSDESCSFFEASADADLEACRRSIDEVFRGSGDALRGSEIKGKIVHWHDISRSSMGVVEYDVFVEKSCSEVPKSSLLNFVGDYLASKDYLWHNEEFSLEFSQDPYHMTGKIDFGDCPADESFVVRLLLDVSSRFDDVAVRVLDEDGDFLLYSAPDDFLKDWMEPRLTKNRLFIRRGEVRFLTSSSLISDRVPLSLSDALPVWFSDERFTKVPVTIMPIDEFLKENSHHAHAILPEAFAFLLSRPEYAAALPRASILKFARVNEPGSSDFSATKPPSKKKIESWFLSQGRIVRTRLRLSRLHFAMLSNPGLRVGNPISHGPRRGPGPGRAREGGPTHVGSRRRPRLQQASATRAGRRRERRRVAGDGSGDWGGRRRGMDERGRVRARREVRRRPRRPCARRRLRRGAHRGAQKNVEQEFRRTLLTISRFSQRVDQSPRISRTRFRVACD